MAVRKVKKLAKETGDVLEEWYEEVEDVAGDAARLVTDNPYKSGGIVVGVVAIAVGLWAILKDD